MEWKENAEGHGYGTKSIQRVATTVINWIYRYFGDMNFLTDVISNIVRRYDPIRAKLLSGVGESLDQRLKWKESVINSVQSFFAIQGHENKRGGMNEARRQLEAARCCVCTNAGKDGFPLKWYAELCRCDVSYVKKLAQKGRNAIESGETFVPSARRTRMAS